MADGFRWELSRYSWRFCLFFACVMFHVFALLVFPCGDLNATFMHTQARNESDWDPFLRRYSHMWRAFVEHWLLAEG